jgi:hypothetical protein
MKLYYDDSKKVSETKIEEIIDIQGIKPAWYNNLTIYFNGFNKLYDYVKEHGFKGFLGSYPPLTAKVCPSFLHMFKNKIALVRSPCDMIIETKGRDVFYTSSNTDLFLEQHPFQQAPGLADNNLILKFIIPIDIGLSEKDTVVYLDNILHENTPFRPCPGVMSGLSKNNPTRLHIISFLPFHEDKKVYEIKKGTVLGVLLFNKELTGLKKADFEKYSNARFAGNSKFVGSNTKKWLQ